MYKKAADELKAAIEKIAKKDIYDALERLIKNRTPGIMDFINGMYCTNW